MPRRRLEVFDEYRYGPRGILHSGDRFRVRGGPVYRTIKGEIVPMYERGVFVFRRFCVRGVSQWIEAEQEGTGVVAVLWVGKPMRSPAVPGLHRRPYRIRGKLRG